MKKEYKYLFIFSTVLFCVISLCLVLIFTGIATPFISSFAVDSANRVYIGTQNKIRVYSDGILINVINPQTSRSYVFTIDEDEKIILSTSTKKYILDLDGNVLDIHEDPGAHIYNKIQYNKHKFISSNGDKYKLVGGLGWTRVVKNDVETIYQISLVSFIVKILIATCAIALFIFPLWMVKHKGRKGKVEQGDGCIISSQENEINPN